jgi:hypothetical protein
MLNGSIAFRPISLRHTDENLSTAIVLRFKFCTQQARAEIKISAHWASDELPASLGTFQLGEPASTGQQQRLSFDRMT